MKYGIVFVLAILVTACSDKAIDFNNKLIQTHRMVESFYNQINEKIEIDTSMETVVLMADSVQKITEKEISSIEQLNPPKGGDSFKKASLNELRFVLTLCKNISLEKAVNSTKEQRLAARTWIFDAQPISDSVHKEFAQAQANFIKTQNIKVPTTKE
jgi:hypothetical protein